jgi:rhomboid protease GluP
MSFNGLLIQVVLFSCLALLFRLRQIAPGYAIAATLNLLVLGVLFWLTPATSGWLSGAVWAMTLLFPLLISAQVRQRMMREDYIVTDRLVRRYRWLRWTGGYLQMPSLVKALALAQQNKPVQALEILSKERFSPGYLGQNATVVYYRISAQWPEFLAWAQLSFDEAALLTTPSGLGLTYVRALGEMGKTEEMIRVFDQLQVTFSSDRYARNLLRMIVLAFCGRRALLEQLFDPNRSDSAVPMSQAGKDYWLAIADLVNRQPQAKTALKRQHASADGLFQAAIHYRLKHTLPKLQLSEQSGQVLAQIEAEIQAEARAGARPFARQRGRSRLTWALMGLNGAVFLHGFALPIWAKPMGIRCFWRAL